MNTEQKKNKSGQNSHASEKDKPGSGFSLSRIEAEGERFLKEILGLFEKTIPEDKKHVFDNVAEKTRIFLDRVGRNIEAQAKELLEKLDLPTKQDLEGYEKKLENVSLQLKKNLDEQFRKTLNRLDIATKEDIDNLAEAIKRLEKDLAKSLLKPSAAPKKRMVHRKPAQA
jgi:polyhydroxyalkanoate synthesis regulator phasin